MAFVALTLAWFYVVYVHVHMSLICVLLRLETEVKVLQDQLSSAPKQLQLDKSVTFTAHVCQTLHANVLCTWKMCAYHTIAIKRE